MLGVVSFGLARVVKFGLALPIVIRDLVLRMARENPTYVKWADMWSSGARISSIACQAVCASHKFLRVAVPNLSQLTRREK